MSCSTRLQRLAAHLAPEQQLSGAEVSSSAAGESSGAVPVVDVIPCADDLRLTEQLFGVLGAPSGADQARVGGVQFELAPPATPSDDFASFGRGRPAIIVTSDETLTKCVPFRLRRRAPGRHRWERRGEPSARESR